MSDLPETVFVDSAAVRARYVDREHLLDKVKSLALLPDGMHATTDLVARYYEVSPDTIRSLVKDHREELEGNGYRVLEGDERARFVRSLGDLTLPSARHLAIFSRRAVLNVGMLLRDSQIARALRTYLLNVEGLAPDDQRAQALRVRFDEKFDYSVLREIAASATDYQRGTERSDRFFASMQNYFYLCVTGLEAHRLKRYRQINPALCTKFRKDGVTPLASEKAVAKNYLTDDELADINDIVKGAIARLSYLSRRAHRAGSGWTLDDIERQVCWSVEELLQIPTFEEGRR